MVTASRATTTTATTDHEPHPPPPPAPLDDNENHSEAGRAEGQQGRYSLRPRRAPASTPAAAAEAAALAGELSPRLHRHDSPALRHQPQLAEPPDTVHDPTPSQLAASISTSTTPAATAAASSAATATAAAAAATTTPGAASSYWDPSAMAPLTPASAAAIARLRAYRPPPFPAWDRLPVTRRAAVLVLLYADRRGDLRVVITMRAASLRNFSGHAALPGGKADTMSETGYQIARREAWEEIGLPLDETKLPKPFRIEALCDLPCSLARTEVAVRPCVAFLHADDADDVAPGIPASSSSNGTSTSTTTAQRRQHRQSTLVEEVMMPRLDAKEVAAVFSAPLHNFLRAADQQPRLDEGEKPLPEGQWYDGYWTRWHGKPWRVHNFHVPVHDQRVVRPSKAADPDAGGTAGASSSSGKDDDALEIADERFLVWGMTGRILVDVARAAYGEEPQFEHNDHYGDEEIIGKLEAAGLLGEKPRRDVGQEAIKEIVKDEKM